MSIVSIIGWRSFSLANFSISIASFLLQYDCPQSYIHYRRNLAPSSEVEAYLVVRH